MDIRFFFQIMGTIPQLSIIKGPTRQLTPNLLNHIFENVATGHASDNIALLFNGEFSTKP